MWNLHPRIGRLDLITSMMKLNKLWLRFPQTADANRVSVNQISVWPLAREKVPILPRICRRDVLKWLQLVIVSTSKQLPLLINYVLY